MNDVLQSRIRQLQVIGVGVGGCGFVLCALGAAWHTRQFFISYLVAFTFWLGVSLGCLGLTMIDYLTRGRWGFVSRRFLEAGFMTLPLFVLLFPPLLWGMHELYPWAQPDTVTASPILQAKQAYLNPVAYAVRALVYFSVWLGLAYGLRRWSSEQDLRRDPGPTIRARTLSGPGLVIYPVTATFAIVDWVMSIEPKWYSTIFAVVVIIGQILTALALITLLLAWFQEHPPFKDEVSTSHFHDLGNLLLAFVIFWTYVSFSQFLIIYSGNLPHEIDWYLSRTRGGWQWVIVVLGVFHFLLPFFLLLFRSMKRQVKRLAAIAAAIFVVHTVEVFWMIQPTFFPDRLHVHWLDAITLIGMGGIWLAVFATQLSRRVLLPQTQPALHQAIGQPSHVD